MEIINLLHQMAAKGIVLDRKIVSTILTCLCHSIQEVDVMELLPTFFQGTSEGASISCNELLMQLHKSHPKLQLHPF